MNTDSEYFEEQLIEFNLKIRKVFVSESDIIKTLIRLCNRLNRNVVNSYHVHRLAGWHNNNITITKFGNNNLDELFKAIDIIIIDNYPISFFSEFFTVDNNKISTYPLEYYDKYFQLGKHSIRKLQNEKDKIYKKPDGTATIKSVEKAICSHCSNLVRDAENFLRISYGSKKVGEGWISETELYYKLKTYFKDHVVLQHASPEWLGRQHLDIYLPELKIAIEYQGKQHSEPITFFGGVEGHQKTIERDERKKKLCAENDCLLLFVYPETKIDEFIIELNKTILSLKKSK